MIDTINPGKQVNDIYIPYLNFDNRVDAVYADTFFDGLKKQKLTKTDWVPLRKVPQVSFAIAHCNYAVLLKFYVEEPYFRAAYINTHDPVSNDSCVEFFISFEGDANYYNLEFNAYGTCLAAYGSSRVDRERLPVSLVDQIKRWRKCSRLTSEINSYQWELALYIPIEIFCFNQLETFKGVEARANFYKCGELLPEPHYMVWKPVASLKPDYHQPGDFGFLEFSLRDKGDIQIRA